MKIVITTIIIGAVIFIAALFLSASNTATRQVCFSSACISAEVADTPERRAQGLMFRDSLPEDSGMLFIFETESLHPFWMKNTLIPLDMIWIDSELKIVHIEYAVPCTASECETYGPGSPSKYIIEVNGGFTGEHGVGVGDVITIAT